MFDPVVENILDSIDKHLDASNNNVSAILLVGGFSESKYLQNRIKEKFSHRVNNNISVPIQPMAAIARGAVIYGLSIKSNIISSRILKYTYGIKLSTKVSP